MIRWSALAPLLLAWAALGAIGHVQAQALQEVSEPPPSASDVPAHAPEPSAPELADPVATSQDVAPSAATLSAAAPDKVEEEIDLAALGIDAEDAVDTRFNFGGFADFTSVFPILLRGAVSIGLPTKQTFYVGNANVYVSKNLSSDFRAMGEIRFSYLPNGAVNFDPQNLKYISTVVYDYADNSRVVQWGGIIMQRLYLEWTLHRLVAVRIGQYLTPYGIWNVDHGSPVYIPVQRPYAINSHYFPERQTGLEFFGRWDASNHSTLGYHFTISNGGSSLNDYRDLDWNKALGLRLYWEHHGAGFFRLGASSYYGLETSAQPKLTLSEESIGIGSTIDSQYHALAFAADVIYKLHGLHLQAEWVSQQRKYTDEGRTAHAQYFAPVATGFSANSLSWAGYGLVAYTFSWFALTPYVMFQYAREVQTTTIPDYIVHTYVFTGGLSLRPNDAVVFKGELAHSRYINGGPVLDSPTTFLQLQAAWAF